MIHLLLQARKSGVFAQKQLITNDEIASQAFLFFFAGFDTVSTCLSFLFYELALNPAIQKKLRDEIHEVSVKVTYEILLNLKYLDMVLNESLRKWPPTINTSRRVTKSFTIEPVKSGETALVLSEGLSVFIPIYGIHRDAKYFRDPEKFHPERFRDGNKHDVDAFIPFGIGPRSCIGNRFALLEVKLLVFHILKNFEIVPVKKTPVPMVLDKYQASPTAKGGMWLGLKKIVN